MRTLQTKSSLAGRGLCLAVGLATGLAGFGVVILREGTNAGTVAFACVFGAVMGIFVGRLFRANYSMQSEVRNVRDAARQAESHYVDVLTRMVKVIESRDKHLDGRSARVGEIARKIGSELGLCEERCQRLEIAGCLQDIGMVATPSDVLAERHRLGTEKYSAIKTHCQVGYDVLLPLKSLADVLPAIMHHHERMNGTGYPAGLRGDAIPLAARILAVADSFEAITHDRPHRAGLGVTAAMGELSRCSPEGYDPDCVEALSRVINTDKIEKIKA